MTTSQNKIQIPWGEISDRAKDGLELIDAALHYSPERLKPALSKFQSWRGQIWEGVEIGASPRARGREGKISHAVAQRYRNGIDAVHLAATHLRKALRSGELVGLGHLSPRTLLSEVIVIPAECWTAKRFNWRESKLKHGGEEFTHIKIYSALDCPLIAESPRPIARSVKKGRGAPGFERYTHEALGLIGETPQFRNAKTYKERATQIKAAVQIGDESQRARFMQLDPKAINGHYQRWRESTAKRNGGK